MRVFCIGDKSTNGENYELEIEMLDDGGARIEMACDFCVSAIETLNPQQVQDLIAFLSAGPQTT